MSVVQNIPTTAVDLRLVIVTLPPLPRWLRCCHVASAGPESPISMAASPTFISDLQGPTMEFSKNVETFPSLMQLSELGDNREIGG